jgi:hypothetical protein
VLEFATGVEGGNCWILVLGQVLELCVVLDGIGVCFGDGAVLELKDRCWRRG